ncbi:dihydropteroate synthase [Hydrogenivirga sp. 128-5-R1-1]|uniref:dihydropteroate synthase n=1 Tax=Hydrogenivirga sp. 128-5-R1-1 TaxID=392423 RepID=UPI00015EF912|nr:dihydropteroate synthase [Hydrogenivirga sp. 128-5-R1-1]EDP73775.1 dihydropteroate synthase [Hydrogenivirga sp. 128-5-R1-1]
MISRIIPVNEERYKIVFSDPFKSPVYIENEEQLKELTESLIKDGQRDTAKTLVNQWINLNKTHFKINYKGKFLNLGNKTAVMGILNLTPDSFSDGGIYYKNLERAVERVSQMLDEGADIIDIGGESTRPGAEPVPLEEEMERVIPVIQVIRKQLGNNFLISIDTYKAKVAEEALKEGADIVNDISGMSFDINMANVIAKYDCPVIVNHTKGRPENMQKDVYYDDVIAEIYQFLDQQIKFGIKKGVRKDRFIIDPGIGFGKKVEHNVEIIKRLQELKILGFPILVGISRKSFIGIILKNLLGKGEYLPKDRLYGGLGATAVAVLNGAHIIRTHDVKETVEFLTLLDTIRGYKVV